MLYGFSKLRPTFCNLAKSGDFTTRLATKPNIQIYEKRSYEAPQPAYCQYDVSGCSFFVIMVETFQMIFH